MYTYCLILRWDSFKHIDIVFTSYIVYFGLVCKFEKKKKKKKKKKNRDVRSTTNN